MCIDPLTFLQLHVQLAHFRERELSEMRLEERNRSHHELTRLRAEVCLYVYMSVRCALKVGGGWMH